MLTLEVKAEGDLNNQWCRFGLDQVRRVSKKEDYIFIWQEDAGIHFIGQLSTARPVLSFSEELLRDTITGLEWALEKLPDECDCPAEACYVEHDTGALIHDEEHCVSTLRGHIEVVLGKLKAVTAGNGDSRQP